MSTERRFWLLRRLSKAFGIAAWIVLVLVVLVTPVAVARALIQANREELGFWLSYAASGLLIFINLIWIAQSIQVIVAIEENTKQTTYVVEKLTTLVQQIRDRLPQDNAGDQGEDEKRSALTGRSGGSVT